MLLLDQREVPWFPIHISELDAIANRTLGLGTDLASDHPGANDSTYLERRAMLAGLANSHRFGREIPCIDYTPEEVQAWGVIYDKLGPLTQKYACSEYIDIVADMAGVCGFRRDNIPQQAGSFCRALPCLASSSVLRTFLASNRGNDDSYQMMILIQRSSGT